jgi:hypothetical protein
LSPGGVLSNFDSGFRSAGVSPVILCAFTPPEPTGGTPALPNTRPVTMNGVIPAPPMSIVLKNVA